MNVMLLSERRRQEWDALVQREPSFAMLQSWEWGEFKQRLGWKVFRVALEQAGALVAGAQLLVKSLPLGLSVAYVPRGPVGDWAAPEAARALLPHVRELARSQGAVFLKLEPPVPCKGPAHGPLAAEAPAAEALESCGFHPSGVTNQPQATIVLDLAQGEDAILQNMRKKTRQYVHRAPREGLTVRFGNAEDLPVLNQLMRLTGQREHFAARSPQYYRSEWEAFAADGRVALLLACHQGRPVAVRMVYRFGRHAAEFHAGSIDLPGLHANYLLVWEAIRWAVAHGCTTYDMWGIPDEIAGLACPAELPAVERHDGLWGVYQFKRGFSSNVVSYIGAYDAVFRPAADRLFNAVLSRGKSWERISTLLDASHFVPAAIAFLQTKDGTP